MVPVHRADQAAALTPAAGGRPRQANEMSAAVPVAAGGPDSVVLPKNCAVSPPGKAVAGVAGRSPSGGGFPGA